MTKVLFDESTTAPIWAEIRELERDCTVHTVTAANGTRVTWRRFGSGTPAVLFHGGHGDWMHWFRNIRFLATRREIWLPDMPGFGDSGDVGEPTFAHLCEATLDTLNTLVGAATPVDLAGFSFGGMVASTIAGQRPIARLALVGSGGHAAARRSHPELLNWKKAATPEERAAMLSANVRMFMFYRPETATPLVDAIYARQCTRTRFRSRGAWKDATLQGNLAMAGVEPLLMWGDKDVTLASPADYSAALANAGIAHRLELVADAGHWLQCEAPDRVNASIAQFWG